MLYGLTLLLSPYFPVFYPTVPGIYIPIVFLPGLFTMVYTEAYSTVLSNLASYGYIVAGIDLFWPVEPARESDPPETVFEVIQWVRYYFTKGFVLCRSCSICVACTLV